MNRDQLIDAFAAGGERLRRAVAEFPPRMWDYKPAPDRWSVREIIIHMPDSEASGYVRCRKIIAQNGVTVDAYDQDAWADRMNYTGMDVDNALALFEAMRVSTTELLRSVDESAWDNFVIHPGEGKVTLLRWLEMYEAHVTKHIEQMRRNFDDWERAGRPA